MKENRSIYIVGIFMLMTMISIGYALLSGQLNINGSAKIKAAKWDIYFKNVKVKSGSVEASVKPSITDKTTVNFEVELEKPGDFYEFNVDVVNDGMIDAMIESISITPELTVNQQKYLSYSVTYFDDVPLEVKDILHAGKSRTLKVRVEYNKNIQSNELIATDENLNIKITIKYVQADKTAKTPTSSESNINIISIVSGDGTIAGNEIAIGNEHFYVISNDGENLVLISKYNLNVDGAYDENITYKQNNDINTISPVSFSEGIYWTDEAKYGSSYPRYVYDEKSLIKPYVDNYKAYLESFGIDIKEARLINNDELVSLDCLDGYACSNAPEWVYKPSYWSGVATGNWYIKEIAYDGRTVDNYYDSFGTAGVRPVIVVSADSL